jgi:hypothetical protein
MGDRKSGIFLSFLYFVWEGKGRGEKIERDEGREGVEEHLTSRFYALLSLDGKPMNYAGATSALQWQCIHIHIPSKRAARLSLSL